MGIATSTVERTIEGGTMAVADAADALAVPEKLVEAYVDWGMLEAVTSATGRRVTIASVGALVARRRAAGRQPTWIVEHDAQAPAVHAIAG